MSFLVIAPELLTSAAADVENIGSALRAANLAAAARTTVIASAGTDEVSTAVATLFGEYGQHQQALARQLAAYQKWFAGTVLAGANSYATAEAVNLGQLVNAPFQVLTGRPLTGNGANGYTNSQGKGTPGGPGGWLYGNGGAGGASTADGVAGGAGGPAGLVGTGGAGGTGGWGAPGGVGGAGGLVSGNGGPGGPGGPLGAGGAGGTAQLFGNGGPGGTGGELALGGAGGRGGLLVGTGGAGGTGGVLASGGAGGLGGLVGAPGAAGAAGGPAIVPLTISDTDAMMAISINGGPSVKAIVDTGSNILLLPRTDVNVAALGTPTGHSSIEYGSNVAFQTDYYDTYNTTVNLGNGIVAKTPVDVVTRATWTTIKDGVTTTTNVRVSSVTPTIGIGPDSNGLGVNANTATAALPGVLGHGILLDEPKGYFQFGPNPLAAVTTIDGSPMATSGSNLQIQIGSGPMQFAPAGGAWIDSGDLTGTIPVDLLAGSGVPAGVGVGDYLPSGTTIAVFTNGGQPLYSYTVTDANAPLVISSGSAGGFPGVFNTGYLPFSLGPIYISNSPTGVGATVFDY